jgi:hypothetical protein
MMFVICRLGVPGTPGQPDKARYRTVSGGWANSAEKAQQFESEEAAWAAIAQWGEWGRKHHRVFETELAP